MEEKVSFLKRKDIEISAKRYLQDALSAMALGLFGSTLPPAFQTKWMVQTFHP